MQIRLFLIVTFEYVVLLKQYKQMENGISGQLRSVISLVDRLRDINLESYIQLPKIVVVGSQSSGKSSLIEQIVGLDFLPRGSGVVTRRPLEIRMVYEQTLNQSYAKFDEIPGKKFTDFTKVKEAIEELTDKVCGKAKNIVDKAIILYVYSKNCPNLTVIDLPGLTRIAIEGQSADIYSITTQMIRKYMSDPTSIILCVIPANQDITNDEVLHMARQVDVLGERTIGCITKIDIMDRGTDARALLLNKGEVPLKLGYVGIKNRSQADIVQKKTVVQSIEEQKMFFSKSAIYSSLPPSCLGTVALITSLTKVLETNIIQFLPQLMSKIKERKSALHQIVKDYGKPLPKTDEQAQALLWSICNQFLSQFKKTIKGHITNLKCREALTKSASHIGDKLNEILKQQYDRPIAEGLSNQKIWFAIRKYEGNNMPGFPSINSFYYLIDPLLKKLKNPLLHCLGEVCDIVIHIVDEIMQQVAKQFINFREYLIEKISKLIDEAKRLVTSFIESIIESEVNYIYTNNDQFYDQLMSDSDIYDKNDQLIKKNPLILQLKKRANIYYKVTVKNLRDLIPRNIKAYVLDKCVAKIQFQIFQACLGEKEKVKEWLKLNDRQMEERQKKEKQYQIIVKAEQFLQTHVGFARVRVEDIKKKRAQREKELKQIQEDKKKKAATKFKEESPIKKQEKPDIPKDSAKKIPQEPPKTATNKQEQKRPQVSAGQKRVPALSPNPIQKPATSSDPKKANLLTNLFGLNKTGTVDPPKQKDVQKPETPKQESLQEGYNRKAGQATDKAVDQMFKNETFKKESTKAVQKGASTAIQKQTGVSEQTANLFGKGAGWVFKQDATQNYLKDQTKANIKEQVQIKK